MVISFTGTGSTGKSTLLKLCKEHYGDRFKYVEEVTRLVKREHGVTINENADNITQLLIMNQHILNSLIQGDVLMDRCCIDGYVYTTWLWQHNKVDAWVAEYACSVAEMLLKKVDIIFHCVADFKLVKDGERSDNETFRDEIEHLMNSVLHHARIKDIHGKVVTLAGSVEERMEKIKQTIEQYDTNQTR